MNESTTIASLRDDMSRKDTATLLADMVVEEREIRQRHARQAARLAELHSRGLQAETGYPDLASLLVDSTHMSRREARRRADQATAMFPSVGVSGAEVAALSPRSAEALAAGVIGVEHVDQIQKTLLEVPGEVSDDERDGLEQTLVGLATRVTPQQVATAGRHALAVMDPDGEKPDDRELAEPERALRTAWLRDGRLSLTGFLDTETGALFERLLSPLTKPRPAEDGTRDLRTPEQRRGDGFAELLELTQRSGAMPSEMGDRPTVVVTLNYQHLLDDLPTTTADGAPITAGQARRLACDSNLIPAVLNSDSEVLDLGRNRRLVSPAQRRALNLRDQGCIKCGRPPQWCQAHHIEHWIDGGATDLHNLCLLCTACHRLVHHAGWKIITKPNTKPECLPPGWMPLIA